MQARPAASPRLAWLLLVALLAACGGDGPASPELRAPSVSLRMTPALGSVGYEFSWPAEPGATSYLVEIGSSVGASDVLSREVGTPGLAAMLPAGPPIQDYFGRFRSRGPGGESPPNARTLRAVDLRSVIEALFFESGALRPSFTRAAIDVVDEGRLGQIASAFAPDVMYGWRRGSRVTVIASTALREVQLGAVRESTDQFNLALGGIIRANLITTTDPDPHPRPGTITIAPGSPQEAGCSGNAIGCAVRTIEDGVILQARLVVTPGSTGCVAAHELGHGLYGFGHIDLLGIEGLPDATMSPGGCEVSRLTPAELDAIAVSYERGMRAGARRQEFVRAGLIAP